HQPTAVRQLRGLGAEAYIVLDQGKADRGSGLGSHGQRLSVVRCGSTSRIGARDRLTSPNRQVARRQHTTSARDAVRSPKTDLTAAFTGVIDINNYGCNHMKISAAESLVM